MKRSNWGWVAVAVLALGLVLLLTQSRDTQASAALSLGTWVDVVQITDVPAVFWSSPRISGNGEWVAFQRSPYLYIGRSNGAPLQEFSSGARWSAISADGSKVVGTNAGGGELYLYAGGVGQTITPCISGGGGKRCLYPKNEAVAISGDGRWAFFISEHAWPCTYVDGVWHCTGNLDGSREVWRVHLASGAVTQVTNFDTGSDTGPWWVSTNFNGSKIAFTSGTDSAVHVYSVNGDGSDLRQLAEARPSSTTFTHRNLTFISGDGQWILFTGKNASGFSAVMLIRGDGTEQRLLLDGYGCDYGPTGAKCSLNYDGAIIAVGIVNNQTMILDAQGNELETLPVTQLDLSYDGLRVAFRSTRALLGLGSETDQQVFVMKRGVTKLAPLEAEIGSQMTYTVTLRHGEAGALPASLLDPLPPDTLYVPGSVQSTHGTATYNAAQHEITWNDTVAAGETVTITFAITPTCTAAPPPPEILHNRITATLGTETLHPLALTVLSLPEKDLTTLNDAPVNGAMDVLIESGGNGPLLHWHDQAAGMTCGSSESADVAYRVYLRAQDGGWQEVGSYPNCARQIQLSPDDLVCRANGDPAAYAWKVVAHDPAFPCREPVESIFDFTTVSCRPEIEVQPEYTLTPGYFLDRTDLPNRLKVTVDWNGPAYETPVSAAPYGTVFFELNGEQVAVEGLEWGAEHVYDMGADFDAAFTCANNTLNIWAAHPVAGGSEYESLKTTLQPTVFPFPGWVEWVITHIPGSDTSFETASRAPLVAYIYDFNYPEPAFEATWTPPGWIPYLGGNKLGIKETQAAANVEAQSDGAGSARVGGQTGLDLGALTASGALWGQGDARFVCGESLDLERAEMGFDISATVEKEAGLVDVIPALKAAEGWPVVGRIIRWVNSVATLKAIFTPGVEVSTEFVAQGGELVYNSGQGTASLDARATLGVEACEGLTAEAYGGGKPYVTMQVPQNPDYLKEVGIDMYYGAAFQAWSFEEQYERKINCTYPGDCTEVEDAGLLATDAGPAWRLIARDYAGPDYGLVIAHPPAWLSRYGVPVERLADDGETVLIPNAYVRSEPALAVREDGFRLLAYVHDDVSKPQGRGTEIDILTWDGAWSGAPVALTDDVRPDYAPVVAFDGAGNGLVAWERSVLPAGITPTLNITFAQSLEIAARSWISATASWGDVITLTDNALMDRAPRLATGADGTIMALWETTDGADALGTSDHPLTYTYALWNGTAWSAPAAALSGLQDVLAADVAVYSATQATLVYVQDMDGVISTTTDAELYYSLFDGTSWSTPVRLTDDAVIDTTPSLTYDAAGRLHLAWLRAGDLVALSDSWDIADVETVRAGSAEGGALGFTLSRSPGGHLALVWQAMGEQGADLVYTIRDAEAGLWGAAQPLMEDADVERAQSLAFADDGTLYLAYQKVKTEFVTRTFEISPTQTFTVTNLPQPGNSQLVFLAHSVGRDLTFDRLTVAPANPAAGAGITLTATLRNAGALAVPNPVVRFYDGSDVIATETLPLTLTAGYTATVSFNWTVPSPAAVHTLRAVADPDNLVAETDETNNEIALQTTLPDLSFATLYTTYTGDTITATARLANTGVLTASAPFSVTFRAADPITGTLLGRVAVVEALPAGESVTVTLALTDTTALAGLEDTLWAIADEDGRVVEADEDNNTAYARLPVLPDLTLTAVDIQGDNPVTITIHNRGPVAAPAAAFKVWADGFTGIMVYTTTLDALTPGDSQTITFTMPFTATELWAYVDPDRVVAERDEGNNLAVRFVGDRPAANRRPTANAGADQTVAPGAEVTLDGSTSSDPDGDPLTYSWQQTGGAAVTFTPTFSRTTFTAPDTADVLTFALTVTDTGGLSDSDTTVVTVTAVGIPTYTLAIHVEGQGSVSQDPPGTAILPLQSSYFSGTHVTLSASPAIGWAFIYWTGSLESTANPAQITMDADKVITATFVIEHRIYLPLVLRNAP